MSDNLFEKFASVFAGRAGQSILDTETGRSCAWREADEQSARMAACLAAAGAKPGDRITAQVGKSPENVFLYLAALRAGFVYQPLNLAYHRGELAYLLGNAEPACVVCRPQDEATMREIAAASGTKIVLTLDDEGKGSLIDHSRSTRPDFAVVPRALDDLAAMLYSSGTTGRPKGVMLTHRNLAANAESLVTAWEFSDADRLLHALPMFHVHGLFVALHCALLSGASMRFLPRFDARLVMRYLPECTVLMGVPTYYTRLLGEPEFSAETCRSMRLFVAGSAPLLPETFSAFRERSGHTILERYGMTETGMNTSNPLHGERRMGSVGLPLPGVSVRVADQTSGEEIPSGAVGELQIKGENVFKGYWKAPEKTAEEFTADGWFRTGDLGVIAEDGYVSIVGRAKDLIISGGLNVYPKEVELCIDEMLGVEESAVVGVAHADLGEAVTAFVKRAAGNDAVAEADVIAHVKANLANFKVPKRVLFVDSLPRNAMGKVQKNVLREQLANAGGERREQDEPVPGDVASAD
jgi:malonyl-CoA/methylmalonyl-CoA synthetase